MPSSSSSSRRLPSAFVYFQQQAALPLHVADAGLSYAVFGALLSLNGLVVVLLELPLTALTQRLPARPVMAAGLFLEAAGFALTAVASTCPSWRSPSSSGRSARSSSRPSPPPMSPTSPRERLRGRYQGAWGLTFGLALIAAPVLGTALYARSPTALWLACGGLGTLGGRLVLAGRRPAPA